MTDQTLPAEMPSGGGSYIRQKDGSLTRDEAPSAPEATPETPVETPIEAGVEPAFKSRRQAAPSPVKEA